MPYIAFKSNARGGNGPGIWAWMHAHFTLRRDDFLAHYCRWSNVESTGMSFGGLPQVLESVLESIAKGAETNDGA
ncbi:hypothetical protein J0H58_36465 [bacterium]|nr:hypothetical protein [bacterium]